MALPGILGKFFGRTVSEGAAFAAGVAIGPVLHPVVREEMNAVNTRYPFVPPDPGTLAGGVAQGQVDPAQAAHWASEHGVGGPAFDALVNIANTGPPLASALTLLRRGVWLPAQYRTALNRQGIEKAWYDGLLSLQDEWLAPADLARGIHRGLVPDPGLLKGTLPSGEGNVPAYPVYPIDALREAAGWGYDRDRLGVLVGLQGLPMGSHEAAQAFFRGVLDENDYLRAIAEGNTRNEWAGAIKEQSRQIPSVTNYVEARVRGWIDDAQMAAGAARHGMTAADAHLEFLIHGRPLVHNQVFIGLLRGGVYDGPTGDIPAPFLKSLQESNMRPEWYNLVWAQRYHYPPFFQTINALNKGWIDAPTATEWLTIQGYAPAAIDKIVSNVAGKGPSAKKLTPTQVKEAVRAGSLTRSEGLARLEADGYSAADAALLLPVAPPAAPPTVAA